MHNFIHAERIEFWSVCNSAATEIVFGETDTGANSDLQGAFDMVQRFTDAYCAYGFGFGIDRNRYSSQTLTARKEEHIAAELERYYMQAKKLLIENRAFLDGIAKRLQEKDTLIYSEIKEIRIKTVGLSA